jgi:hypothetical protein
MVLIQDEGMGFQPSNSAVLAQLGLKAAALAFSILGLSQSCQLGLGLGLAQLRPWLLYAECIFFCPIFDYSASCTRSMYDINQSNAQPPHPHLQ